MARPAYTGLAKQVVELPFVSGLANNFAAQFRPTPEAAMLTIENADLSQTGKFSNRDGFVSLSNNRIGPETGSSTIQSTQMKLFQRSGELGVIANTQIALGSGAGWAGAGDTVFSFSPNIPAGTPVGAWKGHGKIPRPTLGCMGNVTPDQQVHTSDIAVAGNFALIAWHTTTVSSPSGDSFGDVFFRVIDITTGTTVIDTTIFPAGNYTPGQTDLNQAGTSYQAKLRCLAVGNRLYIFMLAALTATPGQSDVLGAYVDMTFSNPSLSAPQVLLSQTIAYGVCTDGGSIFIANVNSTGPTGSTLTKWSTSLVNISGGASFTTTQPIYDLNCSAGSGVIAITYAVLVSGVPTQYLDVYNASTLARTGAAGVVAGTGNTTLGFATAFNRPDVVVMSSTSFATVISIDSNASPLFLSYLAWNRADIISGNVTQTSCPTAAIPFSFRAPGVMNVGRMFTINGRVFVPVVKSDWYPSSGTGVCAGYFLIEIDPSPSQGVQDQYRLPMVAANWATDVSAPILDTNSPQGSYLPRITSPSPGLFSSGTTPPVLYLTLDNQELPMPLPVITITVTVGGTLSFWKGEVFINGVFEQNIDTTGFSPGASLGLPNGMALIFAAGAANINNVWTTQGPSVQMFLPSGCLAGGVYYLTTRKGSELGNAPTPLFSGYEVEIISLNFVDPYRWASRPFGALTAFSGAVPFAYDGRRTFEGGMLCRPRIVSITDLVDPLPTGGNWLVPSTEYFFQAVYTWLDSAGNRWFSAPSYADRADNVFSHTTSSSTANALEITLTVPPCFSGMVNGPDYFKNSMETWLYMSNTDTPGILFLVAQIGPNQNPLGVTFKYDIFSGSPTVGISILSQPLSSQDQIYIAGGELENSPAPACRSIEAHRDRLFAISTYDNNVYYTKPRIAGRGIEWCQETQFIPIPEPGLGLASNETCLMIFTNRCVYAIEGYGPSVTGQPVQAFGALQLISNQMGLYEVNSCMTTPVGVIFRTNYGWWLVDRTLTISFIGDGINGMVAQADQTIAMNVDQKLAVIRIMTAQGGIGEPGYRSYNYWYDSKRWSTDAPPPALSLVYKDAMVMGDNYFELNSVDVIARSGNQFGVSWVDGASDSFGHGPSVSTGWITVSNMAMLKRIWRVIATVENMTGGGASDAAVQLSVYVDWDDVNVAFNHTWTADIIGFGLQTVRAHMPKQKMKAIKLVLQQTVGATANTPGYNFIGLGFEVGVKGRMSEEGTARSA